jgi:hypothetical protein
MTHKHCAGSTKTHVRKEEVAPCLVCVFGGGMLLSVRNNVQY